MFTVGQRVRCVNGSFSYNVLDWARRFPATGDIYTVRFLNKYAANSFYDYFVLIKESDGQYRVSGLGSAPAPTD